MQQGDPVFLIDDTIVYSASDLATAAGCELAALRRLDALLGRAELSASEDAMLARTAGLGDAHEARVLTAYVERFGMHTPGSAGGVADIAKAAAYDAAKLMAKRDETVRAMRDGADVVFQGSFFDGRFHGRSDFVVKQGDAYAVHDTKLARHAKITALLQLAAYADQLERCGIDVHPDVTLVLGDNSESVHAVGDIIPVYLARRARLQSILDEHQRERGAVAWNDPRYLACGRCDTCAAEVEAHRDVLLVAGMRVSQRAHLRAAGVETIEQLATIGVPVPGIPASTLGRLRGQAALQVGQDSRPELADGRPDVLAVVQSTTALEALPAPDPGDVFFDFEGDPLWAETGSGDWGLEYLFGVVEADTGRFVPFWAHDRREEKAALVAFLDYLAKRRAEHPTMHVYHYAAYEKTALLRLVGRHGAGEEQVDDLLRNGVLVDLYTTVRQSILVSQPSYSIKKLEPLYMGDDLRTGVTNAADSVTEYARACEARDAGRQAECDEILASIGDYNHYDCRSTLRLRDWLLGQAAAHGVVIGAPREVEELAATDPDPLEVALLERVGEGTVAERTDDEQAHALLAAALGYHRRERKPFWWAHFERLSQPVDEWAGTRDVFVVESAEVLTDWVKEGRKNPRRTLRLTGEWGPGSTPKPGKVNAVHDGPLPEGMKGAAGADRGWVGAVVRAIEVDRSGHDVVVLEEAAPRGAETWPSTPMAVTPSPPPDATSIEAAIAAVGQRVLDEGLHRQPGLDVLRRTPPPALPPIVDGDAVSALTDAVRSLDRSYVAVQGPPGSGKTYVGSRVVAALVREGWRIGVTAQSHAVVEHFLDAVVRAGVPGEQVAKEPKHTDDPAWTALSAAAATSNWLAERAAEGVGCVVGGTAWNLTNRRLIAADGLDLVVVDEAGQFALANTLAVSTAAPRLLLLGDPSQLPQVSQGTHPAPVDLSALGWLADGHATLPAEHGYFLERSWRMHPALCDRVSTYSYDGRLRSEEARTTARSLKGLEPGLHVVEVPHEGNAVASVEEADEVVLRIRALLGRTWRDGEAARPLEARDVLVVAAYNAQVALLRRTLDGAGLAATRVGTVDKLQGQEAPVVVVSLAASSAADVPRGMEFLLSRNRINVAVSRGQWAAIVVRSPHLVDYLPSSPAALADLGGFLRLTAV